MRVDGYKRHVLHDLDSGLIRAVGITPANTPEAGVTEAISEDLNLLYLVVLSTFPKTPACIVPYKPNARPVPGGVA